MTGKDSQHQILKLLDAFVVGNEDLEHLEQTLKRFNIFEALGCVRQECRHSDFLRFLLDPSESHGWGDFFLKRLLQKAITVSPNRPLPFTTIDLDVWDLSRVQVLREWKNIDILLRSDDHRVAVVIENKVGSTEHSNQLQRYFESVEDECRNWKIGGLYLSPEKEIPSDDRFLPIDYTLICNVVESVVRSRGSALPDELVMVLNNYTEMLRRHLMTESEIASLCKQIYNKHREALDLIYEHRPDRQQTIRELLERLIQADDQLLLDDCSKSYIHFVPKALDVSSLKISDWTKSRRVLLFEFQNSPESLKLALIVGPGPIEVRQRIFACAQANQPPFKTSFRSLNSKWNTLYTRTFLSPKSYEGDHNEIMKEIERQWNIFKGSLLVEILKVLDHERWIWEPNQ